MSVGHWERKVWGLVQHLFYSPDLGISLLEVNQGTRCSIHRHHARSNTFLVASGIVIVELWPLEDQFNGDSAPSQIHVLSRGSSAEVGPLVWHRFRVYQSGQVAEVYLGRNGPVSFDDIERWDKGGMDDMDELKRLVDQYGR